LLDFAALEMGDCIFVNGSFVRNWIVEPSRSEWAF
jgi:hypothetical protein